MIGNLTRRWKVIASVVVGCGLVAVSGMVSLDGRWVAHADPSGIKFVGAGSCSAAACHGATAPKDDGSTRHNENSIWNDKDHHAQAFKGKKGLTTPKAKEIAGKMKIADATKDGKCLSCHSTSGLSTKEGVARVPLTAGDQGAKFDATEGVSCDGCHGPATKYLEPHATKGWTAGERAKGSEKTYTDWGLFDTKNLKFRANACLSCHLKIDHDMVAAGHPELPFELSQYSQGEWIHWRENGGFNTTRVFAMGQAISLREAALQTGERAKNKADAALVTASYKQTIAHAIISRQVAAILDPASQAAIDAGLDAANKGWADGAKVNEAMHAVAKAADGLADKILAKEFDKAITESLYKGMAAEAEVAGSKGFKPAEQISFGLLALNGVLADKGAEEKINGLFDPLGDAGSYDAAKFGPAAKAVGGAVTGGKSIALPAGGP